MKKEKIKANMGAVWTALIAFGLMFVVGQIPIPGFNRIISMIIGALKYAVCFAGAFYIYASLIKKQKIAKKAVIIHAIIAGVSIRLLFDIFMRTIYGIYGVPNEIAVTFSMYVVEIIVYALVAMHLFNKEKAAGGSVGGVLNQEKTALAQTKKIGETMLDRFYVECTLSLCNDFSLEKNVAKAQLLADKYKLKYLEGVEALYEAAEKAHEAIYESVKEEKRIKAENAQKQEYIELNRYAKYYGRDKKIAILTDKMNALLNKANNLNAGADMLARSTQQQETSWAIMGGIADGIAGPGAGVATALNVQAKNAQIRAQNQANMTAVMPAYMSISSSAAENRKNAERIKKDIDLVKEKLIGNQMADEIFAGLKISAEPVKILSGGAYKVSATVEAENDFLIFGDVPAVADGTLIAHVLDDGQEIGTSYMVLPFNGVEGTVTVAGMGLSGAEKGKEYTVTFSPYKLWLMEK